jgi:hypothetical protein
MKLEKLKLGNKSLSKKSMTITFGGINPPQKSGLTITGRNEDMISDD